MKKRGLGIISVLIAGLLLVTGCKKQTVDSNNNNNNNTTDTIPASDVVGFELKNGNRIAKYWKNGVPTMLTAMKAGTEATGISISNGNVYISGVTCDQYFNYYADNTKQPVFWKNGTVTPLQTVDLGVGVGTHLNGYAKAVYAVNDVPYVVGYLCDGGSSSFAATMWVNGGSPQILSDAVACGCDSYATGVYVSNGVSYVSGYKIIYGLQYQAMLWVDGNEVTLTDGSQSTYAQNVFVSNGQVYACGEEEQSSLIWRAVYWKNGNKYYLTDGTKQASTSSIFVYNNDIYVVGQHGTLPTLWKNGVEQTLANYGQANSVYVKDGNVYVAGGVATYTAGLWKNGTLHKLSSGSTTDGANGVFVR